MALVTYKITSTRTKGLLAPLFEKIIIHIVGECPRMACVNCESEKVNYEIVERINVGQENEGYIWENNCLDCGYVDNGYEF